MARKGMDVEQVRSFGSQTCGGVKDQLSTLKGAVTNGAQSLQWEGPDAATFKNDRLSDVTRLIDQLVTKIDELGQLAVNNAEAQQTVSATV